MCSEIILKCHVRNHYIHNEIKYTYSYTCVQLRNSLCKAEKCSAVNNDAFHMINNMREAVQSRHTWWSVAQCRPCSHHDKCQDKNSNENEPHHQGYYYPSAFIYRSTIFKKGLQKLEYMTMYAWQCMHDSVCRAPYPIMGALGEIILLRCNSNLTTG